MRVDTVIENCQLASMAGAGYGVVDDACVAIAAGNIAWAGARRDAPRFQAGELHDAAGGWITPGLVDCHTHLVHGGDRAREFELRLSGATYEEIARQGGGILSTVTATRAASEPELLAQARGRLSRMIDEGLTTVEIKSGYGLDAEGELKMLRVARELGQRLPVRVATTLLAAHALPPEYAGRPDDYIDLVVDTIVPRAAREGLADAVDAFCEGIGFSPDQCERVFAAARAAGLAVKLHADQLSNLGGAALAARFGALSADHIEYSDARGVAAMARSGTVAVLLPGAFYFLREKQLPPVQSLREHGVAIALATDCNPGSSPLVSPLLTMNMGCTLFRLTPEEALAGMTCHAARALGLQASIGTVEQGKRADLCLWDIRRPAELAYAIGANPLRVRWFSGSSQARPADSRE